ncbi:MAG: hypothetical protein ACYDBY_14375 [Thermoanaerobaculia bacterium]
MNGGNMKKANQASDTDMRPEYDFSRGVRGKYFGRYQKGTNVILLEPDVARVFKSSEAVNEALRGLLKVAGQVQRKRAV